MKESSLSNQRWVNLINFLLKSGLVLGGTFVFFILGSILAQWAGPVFQSAIANVNSNTFWYLSRASGIIAYIFLWWSSILGLLMTTRMTPRGNIFQAAHELHQYNSILGIFFLGLHGFVLIFDHYLQASLWQIMIPFTIFAYRPLSVGLGQVGLYLWLLLVLSFYLRKKIGVRSWRIIHYLSFALFGLALLHGIVSGTDTGLPGMQILYWFSGASVMALSVYRILSVSLKPNHIAD